MTPEFLAISIYNEYRELGISKFKAKEASIIAVRISINQATKHANGQMVDFMRLVKKELKKL